MREIRTEITINAPASIVWGILTDIDKYPEWNSFLRQIAGEFEINTQLRIRAYPPGGMGFSFKPKVTRVIPEEELRWVGRLVLSCLFQGEHIFELKPSNRGTHLVHRERFTGMLVRLFWRSLDKSTRRGFEEMNAALKKRAEGPAR